MPLLLADPQTKTATKTEDLRKWYYRGTKCESKPSANISCGNENMHFTALLSDFLIIEILTYTKIPAEFLGRPASCCNQTIESKISGQWMLGQILAEKCSVYFRKVQWYNYAVVMRGGSLIHHFTCFQKWKVSLRSTLADISNFLPRCMDLASTRQVPPWPSS